MNKQIIKKIPGAYLAYRSLKKITDYFVFVGDYLKFKKQTKNSRFPLEWSERNVCLGENTPSIAFDSQYIYHPAWAARILAKTKPSLHTDISSTINFCSIVSAFQPMEFYDYRPADLKLNNLKSGKADLLDLPFRSGSIVSLSCMHTVEHVGLGRYGDPLDSDGDLKAISELKRVLAPGGNLLFAVPIGKAKICFNAHRIYSYDQIMNYFSDLTLKEFSLIPDNATETGIMAEATKKDADVQNYGCGCFWFSK